MDELSGWLPLLLKYMEKKQKFKIFFDRIGYKFEGLKEKEKEKFNKLYFNFSSNELKLINPSKYELIDKKWI